MINNKVQILMSTYNGEKYIREQIDSILKQEAVEIDLLVRDDGSTDSTMDILKEYASKNRNITWYSNENLGVALSFLDLINNASGAEFYAFSDQDDVWEKEKLSKAIDLLKKERCSEPILYYSNLQVVDEKLRFNRFAHDKKRIKGSKYTALAEAAAAGCTMVMNQSALELLKNRTPKDCSMHDSWVFLVCMMLGRVVYDENAYILYRQHENNVLGTYQGKKNLKLFVSKVQELLHSNEARYKNAKALMESYNDLLSTKDKEKVNKIIHYKDSVGRRIALLMDLSIHATSFNREARYLTGIILKNL